MENVKGQVVGDQNGKKDQQGISYIGFIQPDKTPEEIGSQKNPALKVVLVVENEFISCSKREEGETKKPQVPGQERQGVVSLPNHGME